PRAGGRLLPALERDAPREGARPLARRARGDRRRRRGALRERGGRRGAGSSRRGDPPLARGRAPRERGARAEPVKILLLRAAGAAGILQALPHGATRVLWPRGGDAAGEPLAELRARGASVTAPVVYEKRPVAALDPAAISRFARGGYGAVAVSSLSALDVLLDGLKRAKLAVPGGLRWGVLGPETARAFERYSLPRPIVPRHARL